MRKYIVFSIVSGLLFSGCQGIARQLEIQKPQPSVERKAAGKPPIARETVSGSITLYEAMARGVLYNLAGEVEKMERALIRTDTAVSDYDSLVDLVRAAGYGDSGTTLGSAGLESSRLPAGAGRFLADGRRADLATVWNLLDFGLLHAVSREGIQPVSETEGIRRKAVRNILHQTRGLYYRAAGAEALTAEIGRLLNQAREALQMSQRINGQSPSPSREALENQRELIQQIQGLRGWMEELSSAKIDLSEWTGLNPGSDFRVVEPAWNQPNVPVMEKTAADLENLALSNRWEARRNGMPPDAGAARTREAMLRLQPELDFQDEGAGGEEPWAAGRNWRDAGLRLIPGLILPASYSLEIRGVELDDPKYLAVNAAILTQVHLARQRYRLAMEDYRLSSLLEEVHIQLQTKAGGGPIPGRDESSVIRRSRDLLQARMRHYLSFIELENAAFRLYNTMGIDSLPGVEGTPGVASMAKYLDRSMNRWESSFNSAQTLGSRTDRDRREESRTSSRETAPANRGPAPPAPSPSSASTTAAAMEQGTPVIDAAAAERKGRRPVKEVEIFRDVVNIHHSPDSNSRITGQGLIGEKYRLAGWTPDGWLKIEMMDGSFGWIPTKYVRPVEEPLSAADETARGGQAGAGSNLKLITTTTQAHVRSGPGFHQEIKYVEVPGVRHNVQEASGSWYRIRARDGSEGDRKSTRLNSSHYS